MSRFQQHNPSEFAQATIPEAKKDGGWCAGFLLAQCLRTTPDCKSKAKALQDTYENQSRDMDGLEPTKVASLSGGKVTRSTVIQPNRLSSEIKEGSNDFTTPGHTFLYKNNHLTRFSVLGHGKCRYTDSNGGKAKGKCSTLAQDVEEHLSKEYGGQTTPVSLAMSSFQSKGTK